MEGLTYSNSNKALKKKKMISSVSKKYKNQLSLGSLSKIKLKLVSKYPTKKNDNLEDSPTKLLRITTRSKFRKQNTLDGIFQSKFLNRQKGEDQSERNKNDPLYKLLEESNNKDNKKNTVIKSLEKMPLPKIENAPCFDINNPLEYSFGDPTEIIAKTMKKGLTLQNGCLPKSRKKEERYNNQITTNDSNLLKSENILNSIKDKSLSNQLYTLCDRYIELIEEIYLCVEETSPISDYDRTFLKVFFI